MTHERGNGKRARRRGAVALMVGLAMVLAACGSDADAEFPSEDFTWVVPYTPGGGFDTYSRGFAEVMDTNHLPDSRIAVENITPIAEALTGVFTEENPHTLAILPMPAAAAQEIQFGEIAQWKTDEFTILGSIEENAYVVYVAADGPYQTYEDLAAGSGMTALTVERGSSSGLAAAVAIRGLGLDAELAFGGEGSQEVATALVRGDIDFIVYGTSDVLGFIDSGDLKPVLFLGTPDQRPEGFDWLDGIPSAGDVGFPELDGAVTEMRVIVAPAGLGEDETAFLEKAVLDTLNDPDFVAWAEGADRPIVPRDAASTRALVETQIETMKELVPELAEAGLI